tara:strand:+ start:262 stop:483 length:222 start_codon:yes stop_codon:yes gene_type:complete
MKVSQRIDAGELTGHWISYDNSIQLSFGDNEVAFTISEDRLRSLSKRLLDKIVDLDAKRAEELAESLEETEVD